jgi:hypothetical protein
MNSLRAVLRRNPPFHRARWGVTACGTAFCAIALLAGGGGATAAEVTVKATSFQPDQGNEPERAIDGNPKTFWRSVWNPMAALPQSLTLDYGDVKPVDYVRVYGGNPADIDRMKAPKK